MGVGRKNLPKETKILRGTFRKGRENKSAPVVKSLLPEPPAYLSDRAKEIFDDLVAEIDAMNYASASHAHMLALLALRLEEIEAFTAIIYGNGSGGCYEEEDRNGNASMKVDKVVTQRAESMRHAQSLLAEFGLSAAASNKIVVLGKKKENRWEKLA
jgi:phage terminase small subunit